MSIKSFSKISKKEYIVKIYVCTKNMFRSVRVSGMSYSANAALHVPQSKNLETSGLGKGWNRDATSHDLIPNCTSAFATTEERPLSEIWGVALYCWNQKILR